MIEPKLKVDASEFIEHTCEFADDIMQRQLGEKYYDYTQGNDEEGYSYTDEGQDIFNKLLGEVEWFLGKFGVVNGSSFKDTNIINEEGTVICQGVENTSNFTDQILELLCNLGYKIEEDKDDE